MDQDVPFVIETPVEVVDVQQEAYTVQTKETIEHSHPVLHDKNFGLPESEQGRQEVQVEILGEIDRDDRVVSVTKADDDDLFGLKGLDHVLSSRVRRGGRRGPQAKAKARPQPVYESLELDLGDYFAGW